MEFEKKKKFPKAKIEPIPPYRPSKPFKLEPIPPWKHTDKIKIQPMKDEDDMKKAKYNSKLVFPKGDLGVADDKELARMFPRKIKNAGKELVSSKALPYRGAGPMEKDRGM